MIYLLFPKILKFQTRYFGFTFNFVSFQISAMGRFIHISDFHIPSPVQIYSLKSVLTYPIICCIYPNQCFTSTLNPTYPQINSIIILNYPTSPTSPTYPVPTFPLLFCVLVCGTSIQLLKSFQIFIHFNHSEIVLFLKTSLSLQAKLSCHLCVLCILVPLHLPHVCLIFLYISYDIFALCRQTRDYILCLPGTRVSHIQAENYSVQFNK